jgi:hypothetical protein
MAAEGLFGQNSLYFSLLARNSSLETGSESAPFKIYFVTELRVIPKEAEQLLRNGVPKQSSTLTTPPFSWRRSRPKVMVDLNIRNSFNQLMKWPGPPIKGELVGQTGSIGP